MGKLPMEESLVMQVVVRVKSTQSLERYVKGAGGKEDTAIKGPGDGPMTLVEYVVLQKTMIEGKEMNWRIWGTTQESKVEDVLGEDSLVESPALGKPLN